MVRMFPGRDGGLPAPRDIAGPSIRDMMAAYQAAASAQGRESSSGALPLLEHYLDTEEHEWLEPRERRISERHTKAHAERDAAPSEIFGREQIGRGLRCFLTGYLGRDNILLLRLDDGIVAEVERLAVWLGEKGHLGGAEAAEIASLARRLQGLLARAGRARKRFPRAVREHEYVDEEDTNLEWGDYTVVRLERGRVWLRERWKGGATYGPIAVPVRATELLEEGWMISAPSTRRVGAGSWLCWGGCTRCWGWSRL